MVIQCTSFVPLTDQVLERENVGKEFYTYLLQLLLKQNLVLTRTQSDFFLWDAIIASSLGQASET